MALKFNFEATFSADGYARTDKHVLDALHIKSENNTFHLTQATTKNPKERKEAKDHQHHKQNPALTIEECVPEGDYREGSCIPLPSNVSENSIFNNIIASFKHDFQIRRDKKIKDLKENYRQRRCMKDVKQYVNTYKPEEDVNKKIIEELEKEEERITKQMEYEEIEIREKLDKKLEAWKTYLKLPQNKYVLADAFWFMRYYLMMQNDIMVEHVDPEPEAIEIYVFLQGRMAKNYIDLFLTVSETSENQRAGSARLKTAGKGGRYKDSFFKNYFNILSQGVFYSFFYACPKSRDKLNDEMKEMFLSEFSTIFAGIEITNLKDYYSNWYLDLGAGNILKNDMAQEEEVEESASQVMKEERIPTVSTKVARTKQEMRYSSIIETYLSAENFKTRNVVKGYQMNFSKLIHPKKVYNKDNEDAQTKKILESFQLEFSRMIYRRNIAKKNMVKVDEVEKTFEMHRQIAKEVNENLKQFEEEDKKAKKALILERKRLKEDCKKHQRRLSRRRDEELEKGAHEYANYLVSMLNAHNQNNNGQKM